MNIGQFSTENSECEKFWGGHKCINYHERWHFWQNHRPLWGLVPTSFVGSHQCIGAEKSLFPAKCFVITIALYFHPFHLCSFILHNNFILLVNFFCQRIFNFIHTYKLCQLVMAEKCIEVPESRFRVPEVPDTFLFLYYAVSFSP